LQHPKDLGGIDFQSHIQEGWHEFLTGHASSDLQYLTGEVGICFDCIGHFFGRSFDCTFHT